MAIYKLKGRYVERLNRVCKLENPTSKEEMDRCGVYKISFVGSDKFYIGCTSVSFSARFASHFGKLCRGTHSNKALLEGFDEFNGMVLFDILTSFNRSDVKDNLNILIDEEQRFIDSSDFNNELYNASKVALCSNNRKKPLSDYQVFNIFSLVSKGISRKRVANIIGCSDVAVYNTLNRVYYKDVYIPKRYIILTENLKPQRKTKHSHEFRFEVVKLRASGMSNDDIGEKLGLKHAFSSVIVHSFKPKSAKEKEIHNIAKKVNTRIASKEKIQKIKELAKLGLTNNQIVDRLDVSFYMASHYAKGIRPQYNS